jgi:hypothetical protein
MLDGLNLFEDGFELWLNQIFISSKVPLQTVKVFAGDHKIFFFKQRNFDIMEKTGLAASNFSSWQADFS